MSHNEHRCPHCPNVLEHVVNRPIVSGRSPEPVQVHAHAGRFVERRSTGYEVLGLCNKHGLVKIRPMTLPMEIVS